MNQIVLDKIPRILNCCWMEKCAACLEKEDSNKELQSQRKMMREETHPIGKRVEKNDTNSSR